MCGDPQFECNDCNLKFVTEAKLLSHIKHSHNKNIKLTMNCDKFNKSTKKKCDGKLKNGWIYRDTKGGANKLWARLKVLKATEAKYQVVRCTKCARLDVLNVWEKKEANKNWKNCIKSA